MNPSTIAELADLVRAAENLPVPLLQPENGLSFSALKGEIRHDVADGVVSCLAGTSLRELNATLAQDGRCLPHGSVWPADADDLPLAVLMLLGLPHSNESARGTWRDWILGATMVTAEGTVVKAGSRVVKSVAGYDAHKLLVGSRGTLMLPAELHFRTFHFSMAPEPNRRLNGDLRSILRVRLTDHEAARQRLGDQILFDDASTGTFWTSSLTEELPSFPQAWSMNPFDPVIEVGTLDLHRRAKETLDPTGKLAPHAFANV